MFHLRGFSWVVLVGMLGTFALLPSVDTSAAEKNPNDAPRLFVLDLNLLATAKQRLQSGDNSLAAALNKLSRDADRALTVGNLSVTQKELQPPSGDKRDYLSIAPYWWPNPNTTTGLPYVRRDGQINPERDQVSDRRRLDNFVQAVKALGLAYFFTGNETYAEQAMQLLRAWFIDEKTRMNPHLRYAQSIPGRNQIRGAGIIETHNLPELLDAAALLKHSPSWAQSDQRPLTNWFNAYLNWLLESSEGNSEAAAENNHGTWYDVQVASYARFAGRDHLAKKTLSEFSAKRIAKQIASDGRQPRELTRAQTWHYSLFNLEALFDAASIGEKVGIDLWNFETPDKRGIRRALDWLTPFATGKAKWPYKDISGFQPEKLAPLLRRAAMRYRDPGYEEALNKLPKIVGDERWQLLYPKSPSLR
ncbi:MAG TPA: alginate lyase family protein [Candidatus Binatia bacterium]|nr:alginate lyase family protein [Candidatus Binatia bacterium]